MRSFILLCLIGFSLLMSGGSQFAYAGDSPEGHIDKAKKRLAPAKVSPVTAGKVRYEVIPFGIDRGFSQDSGIIRAVNVTSGAELWTLQLFEIAKDTDMEADKLEDYIVQLKMLNGKLIANTERGKRFVVDINKREIIGSK